MKRLISSHNGKIFSSTTEVEATPEPGCNCRVPAECPLPGRCTSESLVYGAHVSYHTATDRDTGASGNSGSGPAIIAVQHRTTEQGESEPEDEEDGLQVTHRPIKENTVAGTYTGLTGGPFKKRFYTHRATFKKDTTKNRTATRLAEKVWELKDQGKKPNISWSVLAGARP